MNLIWINIIIVIMISEHIPFECLIFNQQNENEIIKSLITQLQSEWNSSFTNMLTNTKIREQLVIVISSLLLLKDQPNVDKSKIQQFAQKSLFHKDLIQKIATQAFQNNDLVWKQQHKTKDNQQFEEIVANMVLSYFQQYHLRIQSIERLIQSQLSFRDKLDAFTRQYQERKNYSIYICDIFCQTKTLKKQQRLIYDQRCSTYNERAFFTHNHMSLQKQREVLDKNKYKKQEHYLLKNQQPKQSKNFGIRAIVNWFKQKLGLPGQKQDKTKTITGQQFKKPNRTKLQKQQEEVDENQEDQIAGEDKTQTLGVNKKFRRIEIINEQCLLKVDQQQNLKQQYPSKYIYRQQIKNQDYENDKIWQHHKEPKPIDALQKLGADNSSKLNIGGNSKTSKEVKTLENKKIKSNTNTNSQYQY